MPGDVSPTARALLALEIIQNSPGVTAQDLGKRLGVTERAARRYVAILREAELPIESVSGPYGGYRVGRGLRLPPLMFTAVEAMGLVMAVLEGHRDAVSADDPVGGALAKITRALPGGLAGQVLAVRQAAPRPASRTAVDPELTSRLIESCAAARRLRLTYRSGHAGERPMELDPWAVVLRHSRWYLLGWSVSRQAQRILRVDRIVAVEATAETFPPPRALDPLRALEEHLSQGWPYPVEIMIDAGVEETAQWLPRSLGHLAAAGDGRTLLRATTENPDWYARQLASLPFRCHVLGSPELRRAMADLGRRWLEASGERLGWSVWERMISLTGCSAT